MKRRLFVASTLAALTGCGLNNKLNDNPQLHNILGSAQKLNHLFIGTRGRAKLYKPSDVDHDFRVNGFDTPTDSEYTSLLKDDFTSYRLRVAGEVERPATYTLAELRALQSLTQITRHDCVEGWSAIGEWAGVPLATVLTLVKPTAKAKYLVFHCMDRSSDGDPYYESLDLHQAAHPQTLLALDLNGKPLDADHGAPVRLRVPTQLGYKSAKWVGSIDVVATLAGTFGGSGGYWEDNGYEWYAGI